ncbi:hypothetical protein Pelo_4625 [Pelomyxa schiedti]|nr:hypothetical protein Pelo_4625 [Pelomyxa schiedti]
MGPPVFTNQPLAIHEVATVIQRCHLGLGCFQQHTSDVIAPVSCDASNKSLIGVSFTQSQTTLIAKSHNGPASVLTDDNDDAVNNCGGLHLRLPQRGWDPIISAANWSRRCTHLVITRVVVVVGMTRAGKNAPIIEFGFLL